MTIPYRGQTSHSTYFITANTFEKKNLLQSERMAALFISALCHYREQGKFLLHEFVVMPNHFHLLLTPIGITLERAMQLIKGGFSHRAGKQFNVQSEIWQTSFIDRRVRDSAEYRKYSDYIRENPVLKGLAASAQEYLFSSAGGRYPLDPVPQRLKPSSLGVTMQA